MIMAQFCATFRPRSSLRSEGPGRRTEQRGGATDAMPRLRILTWHVHGSYLYYLAQAPHEFYLPVKPGRPEGYGGRAGTMPWPDNVHDVPAEDVRNLQLDCILFQSHKNYLTDQRETLSPEQAG